MSPSRHFTLLHLALVWAMLLSALASPFATPRAALAAAAPLATSYSQTFDTLAATGTANAWADDNTLGGWYSSRTTLIAGTGTNTTGGLYSFGSAAGERALGSLGSNTTGSIFFGLRLVNDTGATIDELNVSFAGEQWRNGGNTSAHSLAFAYQVGATSLTGGSWTPVGALGFSGPITGSTASALDGNATANRTVISGSIGGLGLAPGQEIWLRWEDPNDSGNDHGLAIDNLNVSAVVPPAQPTLINEVLASTTGTDVEYIELYGEPGAALAGLSLIYVESNNGTPLGTIDFRYDFAANATLGLNGFYLIGTTAGLQSFYGVTPNIDISTNSLENSSATLALVETSSLSGNTVTGSEVALDAVGIADATASTFFFDAPLVGPDGSFFPAGVRRVSDGVDTDTAADWVISDFNLGPANTPTAGTVSDLAPTVSATSPAAGAANVPASSDIGVTFSESVDVAAGAISVECPAGSPLASNAAAGDVVSLTIDPASDLPPNTSCVIVISAAGVTDNDGVPNALAGPTTFDFTTGGGAAITPIHAIQGSGNAASAGTFTVEAIVVGDYQTQGSGQLRGFFIQEEDADTDADPATSEGIFVFCGSCTTEVKVGDKVRVSGASGEFFNMSQLSATGASSVSVLGADNPLPTPASVELPVPGVPGGDLGVATAAINAYFEPLEGMLVRFPDTLAVSEYFELARYGQVILSEGGRPRTFTDANTPSVAGLIEHEIDLARRSVILDDTDNRENRPVDTPNTAYYHPVPGLSTGNFFRGGDTISGLTGVLHWSFAGGTSPNAWRIRPVTEAYSYAFTPTNPRPAAPEVAGRLTVASFNVLNYFLSIDTSNTCSPNLREDCRGADSALEFERQRTKLLAALQGLDADVLGLIEMENTPGVEPMADIVAGLSGYDFVDTGVIGSDAIKVGIIYKTGSVTPVGDPAVLDSQAFVNPRGASVDRNRPAVAQTFVENATGGRFTVVVNHLKSKGSGCGAGDDDTTSGQGNCNLTRELAAQELARWLASDPTGSGDADVLIIGDLNSYAKEDPIVALEDAGYTNLVAAFGGPAAYSYVFDGQLGYLDHALANDSLTPQVAGVTEWHINADEIPLFDYNDDQRTADEASFEEESDTLPLYQPNEFRTSDHDPVLVGLDPINLPPTIAAGGAAGVCPAGNGTSGIGYFLSVDDDAELEALEVSVGGLAAPVTSAQVQSVAGEPALRQLVLSVAPANQVRRVTLTLEVSDGWLTASVPVTVIVGSADNDDGSRASRNLSGTAGADIVLGLAGNDVLGGGAGNDLVCGGDGNDVMAGGDGDDTLRGGDGNDEIDAGAGDDYADGANGNDVMAGGAGDDMLLGGDGNDVMAGGDGNDTLSGALGNDTMTGGAGTDSFDGGDGIDTSADFTPGAPDFDTRTNVP
jgi:uncharacterized protein